MSQFVSARVRRMALAQIGPLTTLIESAATAVGAGIVLCSVATGIWGLATGKPKDSIEDRVLWNGYLGGGFGAAFALADIVLRYGILK